MKIIVDADACPKTIKDLLFKTSKRLEISLILVANKSMYIPESEFIRCLVVPLGADEADDHIVNIMEPNDLIISADIPLADRVIKKGGFVLDPRGVFLTEQNMGQRLAVRHLMSGLRSSGMETGGPAVFSNKEKQLFANQLDTYLTRVLKKS